jgi:cobalt-zinc-cadmium efflux system protein
MTKERAILYALILTSIFFVLEAVGGFLIGSLALISDAAHMLTDVTALAISFVAIKLGNRPTDSVKTFGYYRFEILAAAFNTILLFIVAMYILYEAYQRLYHPPEIQTSGMLWIAFIGLMINLLSMLLLVSSKNKSLNLQSAYLEVWSDSLGSAGVILGALMIQFFGWAWVDSIIAMLIGLWVLPRAWILLKASINILLEGVPEGIDVKKLQEAMYSIEGVLDVHELHVWAITLDKISLTAHVVISKISDHEQILSEINALLDQAYSISHTTLQLEYNKCLHESKGCYFECN